ncbi:DUF2339 domain-containing protein [Segetibacter aerophilus]|uniref:Membrane protein n=1 Tax=Segetibacter aerophilus TaxID=670293 RepID=A0A512BI81_9BACT|nr:DUF2339 domain-containing protein [Segetibacter aerophilus]GEO11678.1 membrane protein [Segetibacter aerophilus]
MTELERQIEELTMQLQELRSRQMQMNSEMVSAEMKLQALKLAIVENTESQQHTELFEETPIVEARQAIPYIQQVKHNIEERKVLKQKKSYHVNREMEDFIGTNVISKVGILVTIVGVFIGAKYAIDNELISPLMRIIAGYLSAAVLIFIAFRLKTKYEYFSSILIGGGLAVTYFITYIAYSFYALFSLAIAFALMVITTGAAVAIALWYNQRVIALLGQVAAYAIPFLLSSGNGNIYVLFSYISIINFGLLVLSFKKDWKLLYHIAFFLTWLIYLFSMIATNKGTANFSAGLTFLVINFFTFYGAFLSYKILKKELYRLGEIGVLLLNALLFFFLGAYLVGQEFHNFHILTWFTIANAAIHFAVGYFIYRLRLVDETVFQFILGLGLLFITVAIPIELDGNWVTILWTFEATALIFVATKTNRDLYLEIALPLIIISVISLFQDWSLNYPFIQTSLANSASYNKTPFVNVNFALSLFVCGCFGFMSARIGRSKPSAKAYTSSFFSKALPLAFLAILYFTLYNEIHFAWDREIRVDNSALLLYQSISLIMFTCLYLASWNFINSWKIKRPDFHNLLIVLGLFATAAFLFSGLYTIAELRQLYIGSNQNASKMLLTTRYFSFACLALLWLSVANAFKVFKPSEGLHRSVSIVFNITALAIISNEFIHWMDLSGYQNQYKLGLSLICGGYALALLFVGMIKKKKHLRISAMVLFAATLLKLFFYDLASLSTISKTIVLVFLGILLLLASFLYNKYKDLLFANEESSH